MPDEARFPSEEEFWRRLDVREVDPDLVEKLRARTRREDRGVQRLPAATTTAVVARLLPGTIPPDALAAFLDEHYDRQLGRGDERDGVVPREQLIPMGLAALDDAARQRLGRPFADLASDQQDALLGQAERGDLPGPDGFDSATWFRRARAVVLVGFGSDPRGMVFMGYPGPSYKPGHVWLDEGEVAARAARRKGYLRL
jgi:hypothetical protein